MLTPHVGWGIGANFGLMVENLTNAVLKYLDGDTSGVVNPAALERRRSGAWYQARLVSFMRRSEFSGPKLVIKRP